MDINQIQILESSFSMKLRARNITKLVMNEFDRKKEFIVTFVISISKSRDFHHKLTVMVE